MVSKAKSTIVFIVFLIFNLGISQNRNTNLRNGVFNNNLDFFALQKVENIYNSNFYNDTKGRYYLYNDWEKCKLINIDNKSFVATCNYNLHTDSIEIKTDSALYIVDNNKIKEIQVKNNYLKPLNNYAAESDGFSNYHMKLTNNKKINLIKRYYLRMKNVQSTTSLGLYETKIEIKEVLFFMFNDGKLIKVPKTNKKIKKVLNDNKIQISKRNVNLKKTKDLISIINQIQP